MIMERTQVKDIMTKNLKTCLKETNLKDVANMMTGGDCGAIPVVDSSQNLKPVGIITDRDIVGRIIAKGIDPYTKKASDCMTDKCFTVDENASISECLKLMEDNKVRRVVVVDNGKKASGIISQADIALHSEDGKIAKLLRAISRPMKGQVRKTA